MSFAIMETTQSASVPSSATPTQQVSSFLRMGGYRWLPENVYWGEPGRGKSASMVGYDPSKGKAGRPTADEIKRKTIDFMTIEAVYALFDRNTPIYIGEGILGKRIAAHFYDEEKVGRWDSFSWLSPWSISDDQQATPTLLRWTTSDHLVVEGKRLVELLEITTIFLAAPAANRQLPEDSKKIRWITQVRHEKAEGTLQNKIDYIVQTLGSANAANSKAQPTVPKKAATSISAPIG